MGSLPVDVFHPLDPKTFSAESYQVFDFIAKYYKNIENYPVRSQVEPGYLQKQCPNSAPHFPEPLETILDDIQNKILPGLTHWQSPNFFAYFQANASTAGFLGEMLTTGLNVVGFNWISSPAVTELEMIVINWIGNLLKLPQNFLFTDDFNHGSGGVIHGSTCEAIVCTLAAARYRTLKTHGENSITKLVVYTSDQTHFTVQKASKLIGIPPRNFRIIPTSSITNYEFSPTDLRNEIEKDLASGLIPLYMCITVGTTATGGIDPLKDLAMVGKEFSLWVHVDAAYAGSACICPEYRHYLNGIELVDSISMNPHKWFLTNMESCCLWVQDSDMLIDSLSTDPEILKNSASKSKKVVDYKDWQIALSRRFRAMKMWVILRRYGVSNLMNHIRSDIELAEYFEKLVLSDKRFGIVAPRKFALVCFKLRAKEDGDEFELNCKLLEAVNCSGKAYMTHAVLEGNVFAIRCAIGATLTEKCHIEQLWKLILDKSELILLDKTNVA